MKSVNCRNVGTVSQSQAYSTLRYSTYDGDGDDVDEKMRRVFSNSWWSRSRSLAPWRRAVSRANLRSGLSFSDVLSPRSSAAVPKESSSRQYSYFSRPQR